MDRARMQANLGRVLLFAGLLLVGACAPKSMDLLAQPRPNMSDMPIPEGFSMDVDRSHSYTNESGLRYVNHRYKGNEMPLAVVRFYEKQMPINGWKEPNKLLVQGRTTLDYVKGREKCRITVYDTIWNTILQVTIYQTGPALSRPKPAK